ncbi:MAG: response regulator [Candidatus Krumholzibacteriota bacterium]
MNDDSMQEAAPFVESDATVVIVDDEEMVLDSLRTFLDLETEYGIRSFTSPAAALEYAQDGQVDVVVSDFLMPEMNGIELLGRFGARHPHAPRILLTGYADKDSAIRAINDIGLFQFIEKPWDNTNLLVVLRNALERRYLVKTLQEKIAEIDQAQGKLSGLQNDILRTFI